MSINRLLSLLLLSQLLGGCASSGPDEQLNIDDSPPIRSAVITTEIKNGGFKGLLASDTIVELLVANQMSRIDSQTILADDIVGPVPKRQDRSRIRRLDRELEWYLDNQQKTYRQCPLGGCKPTTEDSSSAKIDALTEMQISPVDESCVIRVTESNLSVKPTGEFHAINGFYASEHLLRWNIKAEDSDGNELINEITISTWLAPIEEGLGEVLAMKTVFYDTYHSAIADEVSDVGYQLLPEQASNFLLDYLTIGMTSSDAKKLRDQFLGVPLPRGYPVSNQLQWNGTNDTCSASVEPDGIDDMQVVSARSYRELMGSAGSSAQVQLPDNAQLDKSEIDMQLMLLMSSQVKSVEIMDVSQSRLIVPNQYKLLDH
ncbi:MAG: hypothetical protein KTR32_24000 [Granulosicoccus sp.]|nr:hypothetical protein [Granulosicoccus sp.]